jgi:phage-related holin
MKEKFLAAGLEIVAFIAIFFADLQAAMFAIGFLIMIDTFTGIWASWKTYGPTHITSRRAGRIITKLVLYPLSIIVAKVAEQYLAPLIPMTEVVMGVLASVELKSIYEKISILLGFDLWAKLKKQIWKDKEEI